MLGVEGSGFSNLSGTTLTGGSYIVQGPTAGTFNQIEFGVNFTDDRRRCREHRPGSARRRTSRCFGGSAFQPLETQLQTIASTGTLQLLSGRGYSTANTLTDDGLLVLQGGTLDTSGLSIGNTGCFEGFGIVSGAVSNQGDIIADGGALYVPDAIGGSGALATTSGSSLILAGATPSVHHERRRYLQHRRTARHQRAERHRLAGGRRTAARSTLASRPPRTSCSPAAMPRSSSARHNSTAARWRASRKGDTLVLNGLTANSATVVNGNTLVVMVSPARRSIRCRCRPTTPARPSAR